MHKKGYFTHAFHIWINGDEEIEDGTKVSAVGEYFYISGRHVDKYEKASLTPRKGNKINSFFIEECPVNIECQVVHQIDYEGSHNWFIGEIREVHIDENYIRDDALMFWLGQFRTVGEIIEGACNEELLKR